MGWEAIAALVMGIVNLIISAIQQAQKANKSQLR